MSNQQETSKFYCSECESEVREDFDFCPDCGDLFLDDVYCVEHSEKTAKGVCVICREPFCEECGGRRENVFLCNRHFDYEITGGLAKIFVNEEISVINSTESILLDNGFHPLVLVTCQSGYHYGGHKYGDYLPKDVKGRQVMGYKIMVPLQEVPEAEDILKDYTD